MLRALVAVADELGAATVAFPLISAGAYGWPLEEARPAGARRVARGGDAVDEARLVLFGDETLATAQRVSAA